MQSFFVKYILPTFAFGMLAFGGIHVLRSQPSVDKLAPPAKPARSPFGNTVAAAGLIEASSENIAIGAAIPGVVLEVFRTPKDVGTAVKKGTPLFRVDDRHLQAQLKFQKANLAVAQAQYAKLQSMPRPEELPIVKAKARAAEAHYRLMKDQADRARLLLSKNAISPEDATQRKLTAETAKFQWDQTEADLALLQKGAWEPDLAVGKANINLAAAQIEQTLTEIARATVLAPIDGHLLQISVRPGEFVGAQPGQALMMIGDLSKYHVRVDIDEHDIGRFRPDAPAKVVIRGPDRREVKVKFIRVERYVTPKRALTGDNTERVDTRVLQAIYEMETPPQPIYVGQQVDVFIETKERKD